MSTGKTNGSGDPKSAVALRLRRFFVPLLFFTIGVLSAFAYSHWRAGRGAGETGMKTASSGTARQTRVSPQKQPKVLYYVDPMNPSNKSDKPGKAPCGMDMVPVYKDEQPVKSALPPGSVRISPEKQQLIGVRLGEVAETDISQTIRAMGVVTYDETRVAHVHTKFPGWVDKVYADFVGKLVKKGQPLLSIYSPDLVSTEQELLIAKKDRDILRNSEFEDISSRAESLYNATRERLKYWDISDSQIERIERGGAPLKTLTLYSVIDGFVVTRNVFPGQQVTPETDLLVIANLSNIWIMAEVYEYEAASISLGQKAVVTFPSFQGKTFTGKVTYISPEMDPKTRTLKIRVELPNRDFKIKPAMYANVELKVDYGNKLSIPQAAVLNSGTEQMVFVARGDGYFEPRRVILGQTAGDRRIVLAGLKKGEKVVTSANFLIDSESQLKSAAGSMGGMGNMAGMEGTNAGHAGHGEGEAPAADHNTYREGPVETPGTTGNMIMKPAQPHPEHSGRTKPDAGSGRAR